MSDVTDLLPTASSKAAIESPPSLQAECRIRLCIAPMPIAGFHFMSINMGSGGLLRPWPLVLARRPFQVRGVSTWSSQYQPSKGSAL